MQQKISNWTIKKKLILSLLIFIISYFISLSLWLVSQDYYGKGLLNIASHLTAKVKNITFDTVKVKNDDTYSAQFYILRQGKGFNTDLDFTFRFTYNVPITLAIMAAFSIFIKKHARAYTEALSILVAIHFFYLFFNEVDRISQILHIKKMDSLSLVELSFWQYLWSFIYYMFIRFEPFLIGIYLYVRFSRVSFLTGKTAKKT